MRKATWLLTGLKTQGGHGLPTASNAAQKRTAAKNLQGGPHDDAKRLDVVVGFLVSLTHMQHFFNAILNRIVYNGRHKLVGGRAGRRVN
jgi:hypothetical protein